MLTFSMPAISLLSSIPCFQIRVIWSLESLSRNKSHGACCKRAVMHLLQREIYTPACCEASLNQGRALLLNYYSRETVRDPDTLSPYRHPQ